VVDAGRISLRHDIKNRVEDFVASRYVEDFVASRYVEYFVASRNALDLSVNRRLSVNRFRDVTKSVSVRPSTDFVSSRNSYFVRFFRFPPRQEQMELKLVGRA
jgi:hypothetical protein